MTDFCTHLMSDITIRGMSIRNRILSTGHQTYLADKGLPGDDFIAYHEARAKGGAGLIITEAARFHPTAISDAPDLHILSDEAIPAFARLTQAVHRHGARIIGQLSHTGRVTRRVQGGLRGIVHAPSSVPSGRFTVVPREMTTALVEDIVAAAIAGGARYHKAGYDGVELMASHGLLFAQFLNPRVNRRTDKYGGTLENRMRALADTFRGIRAAVGNDMVLGLRISSEELEPDGLERDEAIEICRILADEGLVDYINTTIGSMAGLGGSIHVVPPMEIEPGYVARNAQTLRDAITVPVFVAGRINDPQLGERIIASGQADMVAMTRALITDPDLPAKVKAGDPDRIRACIGCNQACIGHMHAGYRISCIQTPSSGRELRMPVATRAATPKTVMVVGGGPAGLRAAITAAEDGHSVSLHEAGPVLGGQVLLAQALPDRAEFGGLVTNLLAELSRHDIDVTLNSRVTADTIRAAHPDMVILATGSTMLPPDVEGEGHVLTAEDVLTGANTGSRVLVADWGCDWVGIGLAMRLAGDGCHVRLAVTGTCAGEVLPPYLRNHWIGRLHEAGVEVIPFARIYGVDDDTAYLLHAISDQPVICEGVDTVVVANGRLARTSLEEDLAGTGIPVVTVGDCNTARTAEEAIYEGLVFTRQALAQLSIG